MATQRPWHALFSIIGRLGTHPEDSEEARLQKTIMLNAVVLGGIPVQIIIGFLSSIWCEFFSSATTFGFAAFSLASVLWLVATRRHFGLFKFIQLSIPILSPLVATLALGGIADASFNIAWGLVAPLLAIIIS